MKNRYPCPCCGCYTLEEKAEYEICPVCGWEDDPVQRREPNFAGGANRLSLNESRENYNRIGACEERLLSFVRDPYAFETDGTCEVELYDENEIQDGDDSCSVEIFEDESESTELNDDCTVEVYYTEENDTETADNS